MSNRPSAAYRQHHDVDAPRIDRRSFRQAWRVRSRLDALLADGRITRDQWQACVDYRDTAAIARGISVPWPFLVRIGSGSRDARMVARLDAETRLRRVEAAIGALATALVVACVVEDLSWREIARRTGRTHETVRDWTIMAIAALGEAWGASSARTGGIEAGDAGRPVRASVARQSCG